jgi:glycosyltransferase involved in cell wall biosynthesis
VAMERIRILYAVDALGRGGAERRFTQLIKGLDRERFSAVVVLLTDIVHYDEIFDLDVEMVKLDRRTKKDPLIFPRLFTMCRRWKPHIIHAWGSMSAVYAGPVAKLLRVKLINAMIADAPAKRIRKQRIRSMFTFPLSDIIQSNSRAGLEAYDVPPKKRSMIHNGFDFERMKGLKEPGAVRAELGITTRYVVGMVAGFKHQKDYDSLVRAARIFLERRNDVTFICVGDGPDLPRIRDLARGADRIIFTGRRSDVESIVNALDIGILSTYREGISNSIMEYMAAGKPVVATDGGGTGELVVDGETGFLVPQKSPERLAEKIDALLNDEALRRNMGLMGKRRIQNEFNVDSMRSEHMRLYDKLANR